MSGKNVKIDLSELTRPALFSLYLFYNVRHDDNDIVTKPEYLIIFCYYSIY